MAKRRAVPAERESPQVRATTAFLGAVFLMLPLAVHHTYHDARSFKLYILLALCAGYFLVMLALAAVGLYRRDRAGCGRPAWERPALQDLFFPAFAAVGILATLLSGYGRAGILAQNDREQGILLFAVYCLLYALVRRFGRWTPHLRRCLFTAFALACALGILGQLQLDPLGYLRALIPAERARFTSTLGNINFYGAYCVLLFPIPYCLYLHAEEQKQTVRYALLSALGLLGTVAARTEGALLGLLATFAAVPLLCDDMRAVRRHVRSFGGLLALAGLYRGIVLLLGGYPLSALTDLLLRPLPLSLLLALCAATSLALRRADERRLPRYRRIYGIVLAASVLALLLALAAANLFFAERVPPALAKYAVLTPEWGTDRGRIWARAIEIERSFPPLQKLIGGGSGCFARWDTADRLFENAVMDTAHNEYLHYMLTHGLLGLLLYLGFLCTSIARGIRHGGTQGRAAACGCIAYAVHAMVSFAQVFTTPLFFLLLFLLRAEGPACPPKEARSARTLSRTAVVCMAAVCLLIGYFRTRMGW